MKCVGIYHTMGGFIMGEKPHPMCIANNKRLILHMEEAKELAKSLIEGLDGYMYKNRNLPIDIKKDFNGILQEKD